MAWHDGAQARPGGSDGERGYVPGPIARRLARAGRLLGGDDAAPEPNRSAPPGPRPDVPTAWCAEVFERIEWRRFEAVVEALFAQAGFETRSQPHGADGGVDIWLYSRHHAEGDEPASIVQCKHWLSRWVGVKPVRELRGVMAQHRIARGQFVTTSRFSEDARAFAHDNGIALHDTEGLLRLIALRHPKQQEALLAVAFEGDYWRPTCASCGVKMVERTARESGRVFWGCQGYPRCRRTMEVR